MRPHPTVDLLAIATPYLLWPAFNDISPTSGRVAFYCLGGCYVAYSGWRLRILAGWRWIPVMVFSWLVGAQQAICGLLYEHNGKHLCDAGTKFPWILFTVFILALIGLYYMRTPKNG